MARSSVTSLGFRIGASCRRLTQLLALGLLAPAASAGNPEDPLAWKRERVAKVVVQFEGGVLGTSMAEVITRLAQINEMPSVIPLRSYVVKPDDGDFCSVLNSQLQIPPTACTSELAHAILLLGVSQPGFQTASPNNLRPGVPVLLPDITVEPITFRRDFNTTIEQDRNLLDGIKQSKAWQEIIRKESSTTRTVASATVDAGANEKHDTVRSLEFTGYRWTMFIRHDKFIPDLEFAAYQLSNWNRSVIVERATPMKMLKYTPSSYKASEYYRRCVNRQATPDDRGYYSAYLKSEYDSRPAEKCEEGAPRKPTVFVIDTPIAKNPDLAASLADAAPDSTQTIPGPADEHFCKIGEYNRDRDHGTYLAGIIGAAGRYTGYVGLEPEVRLRSIAYDDNAGEAGLRAELQAIPQGLPQVFLFAGEFPPFPNDPRFLDLSQPITDRARLRQMSDTWTRTSHGWTSELKDIDLRWRNNLNTVIASNKLLFIVAAGQADSERDEFTGAALRRTSPASPQNIGDSLNVVVVTACTACDTPSAKIWGKANYSSDDEQIVHLAAPGGEEIPGLTSMNEIGNTIGGTSAAAAFTAGVAAKMLACYPSYYSGFPETVKERLLLTARPNIREEDIGKAQAGTVEPSLALIDPRKSWLKVPEQDIREVKVLHWCEGTISLQDDNGDDLADGVLQLSRTRRIMNMGADKLIGKQMTREKPRPASANVPLRLNVALKGPGKASSPSRLLAAVQMGDAPKCALRLNSFHDLILNDQVKKVASCAEIAPCSN